MAPNRPAQPANAFFEELRNLDPGVANRWRARSHGNRNFVLDGPDVEAIVRPMIHNLGLITQRKAAALMKLVVELQFTPAGMAVFKIWLAFAQSDGRMEIAAEPLTDLTPIYNCLGMGTLASINFVSPGTGLTYAPGRYLAIRRLIELGKITVLEVKLSGLEQKADLPVKANYRTDKNQLYVYQSQTPVQRIVAVVHECTHAIQDWQNVRSMMRFTEADAFIAGTVVDIARGTDTLAFTNLITQKAVVAARQVLDGPAVLTNASWTSAYTGVVNAIENSEEYREAANDPMITRQSGEGNEESDEMDVIVTAIEKKLQTDAANFSRWAEDAWKTTFGGIPRGMADALPGR
jgi:hypothetical protein